MKDKSTFYYQKKNSTGSDILSIDFAGIHLRNPLLLASGFLGISQEIFNRLYRSGIGAIVSKSISINPMEGYKGPTVISINEKSYLNAIGLSNPGAKAFSEEISQNTTPLIVSLVGSSEKDFPTLIKKFDNLNILGYEINLSCPHVAKMGMEVGDDPNLVTKIIRTVKNITTKPVIIKVGVGSTDIVELAKTIQDSGADAITAINSIRAMAINIETGMPILSNKIGGLSGASIKPIGIRSVYEITKKVDIPVIGCGGIFSWEDVIEYIQAGACAVEIGSVIGNKGIKIFHQITRALYKYLDKKGYKNIMEVHKLAHKY
ncbi:MAG: dihydroorotate dehydrogenase [Nitrososphaeraceae archaeon]|nr:dihydroorotate dehydrogenase [Nitrososphaeraceae archaeon]